MKFEELFGTPEERKHRTEYRHIIVSEGDDNIDVRRLCHYFPNLAKMLGIRFEKNFSKTIIPYFENFTICGIPPITKPSGLIFAMHDKHNKNT